MDSPEILKQWLAAINGHDVDALSALMADSYVFVVSMGNRVESPISMGAGWRSHFATCPDYWIRIDHVMADGDTMLVAGEAGGTIDGKSWQTPAAWKTVIREGRVLEWRVFYHTLPWRPQSDVRGI